jgi:hypothetical protein
MRARSHALAPALAGGVTALLALLLPAAPAPAQSQPAWQAPPPRGDAYRPPPPNEPYYPPGANPKDLPGEAYPGPYAAQGPYGYPAPQPYSSNEILEAGHSFFGSTTKGLAAAVEFAFQRQGLPNGYILGQDAGAAFVAGLRYGEGILYTKDAGTHRVYWQGPSVGFDLGGDGSKVMVLVYNLRQPGEVYRRFGGVAGAAYLVGGVGLTFQQNDEVIMAPIRTGVGLRLGANIGYLKYTPQPTWDPF